MPNIRSRAAKAVLRVSRFQVVGEPPEAPIYIVVAAPHTTNWDLPVMLAVSWASHVSPKWLGKKELFRGPMGPLLRAMGGIPIDRQNPEGVVQEIARMMAAHQSLALAIPPEGTRSKGHYWKTGFHRIAAAAGVPVVLCFLDGPSRSGGWGPVIEPAADVRDDIEQIRAFYADKQGLRPSRFTPPRLRNEPDTPPA